MRTNIIGIILIAVALISLPAMSNATRIFTESSGSGAIDYDGYTYDYYHKVDFSEDIVGAGIVDYITLGCTVCDIENRPGADRAFRIMEFAHVLPVDLLDFGGVIRATWVVTAADIQDLSNGYLSGAKPLPENSPKFILTASMAINESVIDWTTSIDWGTEYADDGDIDLRFGTLRDTQLYAYDTSLYIDYIPGETDPVDPVPEPATLALMGLGLIGGAFKLRRKK